MTQRRLTKLWRELEATGLEATGLETIGLETIGLEARIAFEKGSPRAEHELTEEG